MSNIYEDSGTLYPIDLAIKETEEFIELCWKDWKKEDYLPIKSTYKDCILDAEDDLKRMKADQARGITHIRV
jgi:hypothetical protein